MRKIKKYSIIFLCGISLFCSGCASTSQEVLASNDIIASNIISSMNKSESNISESNIIDDANKQDEIENKGSLKYLVKKKENIKDIKDSIIINDLEIVDKKTLGNSVLSNEQAMEIDKPENLLDYSKETIDNFIEDKYKVIDKEIPRYITEQGGIACWMRLEYIDFNEERPSSVIFDMENIKSKEDVFNYISAYLKEHPILNFIEYTIYDIDKEYSTIFEKYHNVEDILIFEDKVCCNKNKEIFVEIMKQHEGSFNIAGCDDYVLHVFSVSYNDGVYGLHIRMTYPSE